jgi:mono/diheme cytochrome c family protein
MKRLIFSAALLLCASSAHADERAAGAPSPDVERGHRVFDRANCSNCHAPAGNGPDLRNEATRNRTGEWLREQIATPEKHKPDTIMPPQKLTAEEMADLVAFLQAQRGEAKPAVASDADGKALFEARCRTCHFLPVPTTYSFTPEQWASVVKFMIEGKKASRFIAKSEQAKIVDYLQGVARSRVAQKEAKR